MSARYLDRYELAELVGCEPRSLSCMRRWLQKNHWPFETNVAGVPRVSKAYHDARMSGQSSVMAETEQEPDFEALRS